MADVTAEDFDFAERLEELHEELVVLNLEARTLEEQISEGVSMVFGRRNA